MIHIAKMRIKSGACNAGFLTEQGNGDVVKIMRF